MGARTDQAERRVNEQRDKVSRMLADLENRVRDDMDAAKARASEEASRLTDRVKDMPGQVPGSSMLSERVNQHPLTSVAGAFTAGIALGMLSEGFGGDDGGSSGGGSRGSSSRGGSSGDSGGLVTALANQLSGIAMTSVANPAKDELQKYLKNAVTGFFEGERGGGGRQQPRQSQAGSTDPQRLQQQGDPVDPVQGNPGKA